MSSTRKEQEKEAKRALGTLVTEGEEFTYENFSTKSRHGYPAAYVPEWVAWRARVKSLVSRVLGPESAPLAMLRAAEEVRVLGNEEDKFQLAKSYYLGALRASMQILDEDQFDELPTIASSERTLSNRVFIVHGHDAAAKNELEIFLAGIGLEPVVLHRQPDEGRTVIEKFEKYSDVGYAFILLTPDEVSYLASEEKVPEADRELERRARPNVIFEFGFFVGRLGRNRVCCLHKDEVVLPSDVSGLLYKRFNASIEEVGYAIIRELRAAGYRVELG